MRISRRKARGETPHPERGILFTLVAMLIHLPLAAEQAPRRPVATYSIVARDAATEEIGVAVQSHWFSVGAVVPGPRRASAP